VQDLVAPHLEFFHDGTTGSADHNQYVHEGYTFQSNYQSGLRILDLSAIDNGSLSEAGFFDTYPASDSPNFNGTWSNYPFYASGIVGVSDINRGLFVLAPQLCRPPVAASGLSAQGNGDHRIDLAWSGSTTPGATYEVDRILGGCAGSTSETIASGLLATSFSDMSASGQVTYGYRVRSVAASGACAAAASACVEASTTGTCTAPPLFAGIASAQSAATPSCAIDLSWQSAQSLCGSTSSYQVYRSGNPTFVPTPSDLVADGIADLSWTDAMVAAETSYTYVVRAGDAGNGAIEGNSIRLSARASGPITDGEFFSGAEVGTPILADNGEAVEARLPLSPAHVAWEIVDTQAHTGERSYYSGYNNAECLSIGTGPITLSAGMLPKLEFWTRYGIESGWDGGVVQISSDGGSVWTTLTPIGGYPATLTNSGNACGFPLNSGAFTGTNLTWTQKQIDLAAYAGQAVQLRFRFGTDGGVTEAGWWIDDIRISHAQVPGICQSSNGEIFFDGFEGR
jgi:hypothetical protein